MWLQLQFILGQPNANPIILRVKPGSPPATAPSSRASFDLRPQLRTRSALGVLRNAAEGDNFVRFGTSDEIEAIIGQNQTDKRCDAYFWRTAGERSETGYDNARLSNLPEKRVKLDVFDYEKERTFSEDRRLILVVESAERPANAFVSVPHNGAWYSIRADDWISKRNLSLISQINTIQAVAPSTAPLTPTISVGAR